MKRHPLILAAALLVQHALFAFVPFDGTENIEQLQMYNQMTSASEMVGGSLDTGDYARVITVPQQGAKVMDVSFSAKNKAPIKKGDPILVQLVADGEAANGGSAQLHIKLQVNERPWPTLNGRNQAITSEPETYEILYTADRDYYPGEVGFVIFAAQQAQTIRLRSLKMYAGAEAVSKAGTGETVLYDIDFEDNYKEVAPLGESEAAISGSIPAEFTEDTSWANVDVVYTPVEEGVFDGKKSLRIEVSDVVSGYAQLRLDQFPASSDHYLKLNFAIKSTSMSPFTLAIREKDVPFKKYWQATASGAPEWREVTELIPPTPENQEAQFIIEFPRPGLYEFDNFTITAIPKEAMEQSEQLEGNLILNSSFPFGYQRPWRGYTGFNNGLVHLTDESEVGPTGEPALKVLGTNEHEFLRLPFNGKAGSKHTVSFWAKTAVPGTWITPRIGPPSEKLYIGDWGTTHTLTDQWKRVSHTVMLPYHSDGFYELQIYMHNTNAIWIDGIMVEASDTMNEFQRVAPVELTVIPTHGAENKHNVFFKGEPISLDIGMLGERPEGSRLVVKTQPFGYDGEELVNELAVAGAETKQIKIDIPFELLGLPEFGTAYVRFQVEDAEGNPLSKVSETSVHVVREPRGWGQFVYDSPFGVHVAPNEGMITTGKRLGFNWIRSFNMSWRRMQPAEGDPFDFSFMDELVGWWRKNHFEVLGILGHTPNWANMTGGEKVKEAGWKNRLYGVPDEYLDDWAEYAAQLASRYQDVIHVYESWNEPFLAGFFLKDHVDGRPIQADPETLFKMTKAVKDRFEADGLDIKLAWNQGSHYPHGDDFDRGCADLGLFDLHEVVTYHSYERALGGYPGDPYEEIIAINQAFKADYGQEDKPLWNSESGPGGGHMHNIYPTMPITDMSGMEQHYSKYLSRAWNSMLANGVERNFIYFLNDGGTWKGDYDLMQPDGSVSPNLVSFSNLAWHIEGKRFVELTPLSNSFHAYVYEGKEGVAVALIPKELGKLSLDSIPADWRVSDLYGNKITRSEAMVDFWIHAEGAKSGDVIPWLKENWGE